MGCGRCRRIEGTELQGALADVPDNLRAALDEVLTPKKKAYLYRVQYPYGQLIVDKGTFTPPCGGDACSDCKALVVDSQYGHIPLALLLENPVEVFIDYPAEIDSSSGSKSFRFAPLRLIPPGELFGVFEALDALISSPSLKPSWSVSSGSRSVWILAPLEDNRLTKHLSSEIANETKSKPFIAWEPDEHAHWQLIQECSTVPQSEWNTDILIFPGDLVRSLKKTTRLFNELLSIGWRQSATLRHSSIEHPSIRDGVARVMKRISLPSGEMHHYNAVLHFMNVLNGERPAYKSCHTLGKPAGPFIPFCGLLQKALLRMGRGRQYQPIVMQPHHLGKGESGLYSCRCPSLPGARQEKPQTYLSLIEGYRDVINSLRGDVAGIVNSRTVTLYSPPLGPTKDLPRGIAPLDSVPLEDFIESNGTNAQLSQHVFLKSQFLVSCMRLTRAGDARKSIATT